MTIERAPNGWRRPDNFLSLEETYEMLGHGRTQKERQQSIRKFMYEYMNYSNIEVKEFVRMQIRERMRPSYGHYPYTMKESIWLAHLDLLNAAAWQEENEEFIIEF